MICTFFLSFEVNNFPSRDLCPDENLKMKENFEKETAKELKYEDYHSIVRPNHPKLTTEEKMPTPTIFDVRVDVHNSSLADEGQNWPNQLCMQNEQFARNKTDKAKIGTKDDNKVSTKKQCKFIEKRSKVTFSDIVQIKYYEKESSDESKSNKEHTETSGEIIDDGIMETGL